MRIIPKKTKYRFQFRNKIQTKKISKYDIRCGKGCKTSNKPFKNLLALEPYQAKILPSAVLNRHIVSSNIYGGLNINIQAWLPDYGSNNLNSKNLLKSYGYVGQKETCPMLHYDYGSSLLFGTYGFAFANHGKLRSKFIETLRLDISKILKKKAKVWLRLCCDTPVTARPVETRMGKGKGALSHYEVKVKPGMIFFEFSGLELQRVTSILTHVQKKSPYKLTLVY